MHDCLKHTHIRTRIYISSRNRQILFTLTWILSVFISIQSTLTSSYTCSDGCNINDAYLNDDYCDCSDCGDEDAFDCRTCICPTSCGAYEYCTATTSSSTYDGNLSIPLYPTWLPTYSGQTLEPTPPTLSPTRYPTVSVTNASISLIIDSKYHSDSAISIDFVLLDQSGNCYTDDVSNWFGCTVNCHYDLSNAEIYLQFVSCGDTENSDQGLDCNCTESIWKIDFGHITGMESALLLIEITPVACQSWKLNMDNFTTSDLTSLRATTSSVQVIVLFDGPLTNGICF